MGFLQAVYSLGKMAAKRSQDSVLSDIMNFLQLPHPIGEPDDRLAHVIRVWLEVADPDEMPLLVNGISNIDEVEYPYVSTSEEVIREKYLFREPVGKNVQWRYSPLYKLGKGGSQEPLKELTGNGWQEDKECRFYKLSQSVLREYENAGYFTKDSVNTIMCGLVDGIDRIVQCWSDKKRSYLLLFGIDVNGEFRYPGEVPAFVEYFRQKLNRNVDQDNHSPQNTKKKQHEGTGCTLCGCNTDSPETLDKVFKFATFDKPGFLPGAKDGSGVREKVYPICQDCFSVISAGKEEMENRFVNYFAFPGIGLYVVPEIISGNQKYFELVADRAKDFLTNGIKQEDRIFKILTRQDDGIVFHFLFTETNQAQLILHCLVEDVPPTRLKKLRDLWKDTCTCFGWDEEEGENEKDNGKTGLDTAIRQIIAVLFSLAGKREQDKMVMREKALSVIGALLNEEYVSPQDVKTLVVSRLAGLLTDPDWISPKDKKTMPGRLKLKGMAEVIDFLIRVNRRRVL